MGPPPPPPLDWLLLSLYIKFVILLWLRIELVTSREGDTSTQCDLSLVCLPCVPRTVFSTELYITHIHTHTHTHTRSFLRVLSSDILKQHMFVQSQGMAGSWAHQDPRIQGKTWHHTSFSSSQWYVCMCVCGGGGGGGLFSSYMYTILYELGLFNHITTAYVSI